MPVIDPLYPFWQQLTASMKWEQDASDAMYQRLMERYDEDHRHFHVRGHLKNIFDVLELDTFDEDDQALLIAVTFWHDAVYDTSSTEMIRLNEEKSAVLAGNDLRGLGADEDFIRRVEKVIRDTRTHECDTQRDPVAAHFLDCDMATLAGSWDDYCVGPPRLENEYKTIPRAEFYRTRLDFFIDPLLKKPGIYLLAVNEAKWGAQARTNLKTEKALIEAKLTAFAAQGKTTHGVDDVTSEPAPR